MFFYFSKLIWMLVAPTNITILLLLGGFTLTVLQKIRAGVVVLGLGVFGVVLFGILPTGYNLTSYLERQADQAASEAALQDIDGIILLGGMFNTELSAKRDIPEASSAIDRVHAFQELAVKYPHVFLFYTGGKGDLLQNNRNEADIISDYFHRIEFRRPVIYERDSRNTFENAQFLARKLQRENMRYILITSAFHMPRAKAVFEKAGYDIAVYPVDYRTNADYKLLPVTTAFSANFLLSDLAVREIVGHLAYRLAGKL